MSRLQRGHYYCRIREWKIDKNKNTGSLFFQFQFDVLGYFENESDIQQPYGDHCFPVDGNHTGTIRRYLTPKAESFLIEDLKELGIEITDRQDLRRLNPFDEGAYDLEGIEFAGLLYYNEKNFPEWRIYKPEMKKKSKAGGKKKEEEETPLTQEEVASELDAYFGTPV